MSTNPIRRVAILGAGVMGAQIAAHCINTRIPVILFDLETPTEGGESAYKIISNSINALKKLKPAPLGLPEDAELIRSAHYGADLPLLSECDLVIEAAKLFMARSRLKRAKRAPYSNFISTFAA